ncbi:polysaccharide pyruvyl transferase family protein [Oscillospiraceae bacterium HV4-5-C5C]|nr:polysaccharide pyruvyl transferase family protein [Oscillospiraceae bacterium HV4-5-C5C]
MKVGIITFHRANNYGAVLQAYALQEAVRQHGHGAFIIDYESSYLKHPFALVNWKRKGVMSQALTLLGELSRIPRIKPFDEFRRFLNMTASVEKDGLTAVASTFDVVITGSDQVWNYMITNQDGAYFLDFVQEPTKKGSYAASFGFSDINDLNIRHWYSEKLASFSYLNVREKSALPLVKELTGKPAKITIDPTLLLSKADWDELAIDPPITKPYILTYQVGMDPNLIKCASHLAKKYGYKVYSIPFPQGGMLKTSFVLHAGPLEWLGWIKNAAFVVTDSFHGVALSIAFEKEFYAVISSRGSVLSSRIIDLLQALDIDNHRIKNPDQIPDTSIDYSNVGYKLQALRQQSDCILQGMCETRE